MLNPKSFDPNKLLGLVPMIVHKVRYLNIRRLYSRWSGLSVSSKNICRYIFHILGRIRVISTTKERLLFDHVILLK
jgi:hypothetical protein